MRVEMEMEREKEKEREREEKGVVVEEKKKIMKHSLPPLLPLPPLLLLPLLLLLLLSHYTLVDSQCQVFESKQFILLSSTPSPPPSTSLPLSGHCTPLKYAIL